MRRRYSSDIEYRFVIFAALLIILLSVAGWGMITMS